MIHFATNFWLNKQVKVNIFDDGNISVPKQNNIWRVTDIIFNGNKLQLENCIDPTINIPSISAWKVRILETSNNSGDNPH